MGVQWLCRVRPLHLATLGLVAICCLLYVAYVSTGPLQTSTATPTAVLVDQRATALAAAAIGNVYAHLHHRPSATGRAQQTVNVVGNSSAVPHNNTAGEAAAAPAVNTQPLLTGDGRNGSVSSTAPPPPAMPLLVSMPAAAPASGHDLTKGIAAETIYEAGHGDDNPQICPNKGKDLQLLIAITSAPSHEAARLAIRQTWGHYAARRDVAITFMLGSTAAQSPPAAAAVSANSTLESRLRAEHHLYGDIIRGRFIDTYDNLTLKTISMLEWVDAHCARAAYLLKTDDDMFINVPRLLDFAGKHKAEQRAIYGRLAKKWKPIRNRKSKYYISPQQYRPAVFPDFTTGPAYLMPARLARELYTAALNHTYFKLEDVFVTGIVANGLRIRRVHVPEFLNKRVSLTPCSVQRGISIHMVKGAEQYDLWKKLLDGTTKCK